MSTQKEIYGTRQKAGQRKVTAHRDKGKAIPAEEKVPTLEKHERLGKGKHLGHRCTNSIK